MVIISGVPIFRIFMVGTISGEATQPFSFYNPPTEGHLLKEKKCPLKHIISFKSTLKCLSIGTPNTTTFPFVPNGKWWLLGVPIFEHIINRL